MTTAQQTCQPTVRMVGLGRRKHSMSSVVPTNAATTPSAAPHHIPCGRQHEQENGLAVMRMRAHTHRHTHTDTHTHSHEARTFTIRVADDWPYVAMLVIHADTTSPTQLHEHTIGSTSWYA